LRKSSHVEGGLHRKSGLCDFRKVKRDRKSETSDLRVKPGNDDGEVRYHRNELYSSRAGRNICRFSAGTRSITRKAARDSERRIGFTDSACSMARRESCTAAKP